MPELKQTISDAELKALESDVYDVPAHFQSAVSEKARKVIDRLVKLNTDKNPNKLPEAEKENIIKHLDLETAKERTDRMEKELIN